jgi:hypothetical protein
MERIGTVETICRYPLKRSTLSVKAHRSCNSTLRLRKRKAG